MIELPDALRQARRLFGCSRTLSVRPLANCGLRGPGIPRRGPGFL